LFFDDKSVVIISPMLIEFIVNPASHWRRVGPKLLSTKNAAVRLGFPHSPYQIAIHYPRWLFKRTSYFLSCLMPLLRMGLPGLRLLRENYRLQQWMKKRDRAQDV